MTLALPPRHLVGHVRSTQHRPVGYQRHIFECMPLVTHETGPIMDKRLGCVSHYTELQVHLVKKIIKQISSCERWKSRKYIPWFPSMFCLLRRVVSNSAHHDLCISLNRGGIKCKSVPRTVTGALSRTPFIVMFAQELFPFIQVCARWETIAASCPPEEVPLTTILIIPGARFAIKLERLVTIYWNASQASLTGTGYIYAGLNR